MSDFHAPCDLCGGQVNVWFEWLGRHLRETFGEFKHYYPRSCINTLKARVAELEAELEAAEKRGKVKK